MLYDCWLCSWLHIVAIIVLIGLTSPTKAEFLYNGVTAHRGNSSVYPENTMPSFASAIAVGADWMELDIHESSDGYLVVIHDTTTGRVGDKNITVASSTYAQLETVDVAYAFRISHGLSYDECPVQSIPLLSDVIAMVTNQTSTRVSIQPKADVVDKAIALVTSMHARPWVGFNDGSLSKMRQVKLLSPEIPVFWDVPASIDVTNAVQTAKASGFEAIVMQYSGISVDKVKLIHNAGLEMGAYTVDSTSTMSNLILMGTQRIYTDRPSTLLSIRKEDTDSDTLPDIWERRFFGSKTNILAQASVDADADGMSNHDELLAGTDPMCNDSSLRILKITTDNNSSNIIVTWTSEVGRSYELLSSTNALADGLWQSLLTNYPANPPYNRAILQKYGLPGFFMVRLRSD